MGGAGVSWPETGVGAFSAASRQLNGVVPRGVFDLAGVLELDEGSVGDGRWFMLVVPVGGCKPMRGCACCNCCCCCCAN